MDDERAAWAADVDTHRVIRGRRWRVADPRIPADLRQRLVDELMAARRAVKAAGDDAGAERAARDRVGDAKIALGERGVAWWAADVDPDDADERVRCAARALERTGEVAVDEVAAVTSRSAGDVARVLG